MYLAILNLGNIPWVKRVQQNKGQRVSPEPFAEFLLISNKLFHVSWKLVKKYLSMCKLCLAGSLHVNVRLVMINRRAEIEYQSSSLY